MKNIFRYMFLLLYITGGVLFAKEYTLTSFYAAYDMTDNSRYVLVMPMVHKVYTHEAGKIKPEDLKQIDNQFVSFPTYKNGELCFPELKSDASGDNGASVMADQCYSINFFYTQKEFVDEGTAFILTYTRATGGDKVYEGLAGNSASFKVVRDGDIIDNNNSITGEDYSIFRFDKVTAKVILGEEIGSASVQGTIGDVVNPLTAVLELDVDGDGIYNGKADKRIEVASDTGTFSMNNIEVVEGVPLKGQLVVTADGYAPYQRVLTLNANDGLAVDASAALNKPALTEVVSLEGLSESARMNSVIEFGIRKDGEKVSSFSRLMSLSEFRAQADVPMGDDRVSTFTIGTDTIPAGVKTMEARMQAFDSTNAEDIKNFPGEFKGTGLSGTKFAEDDEVGLESAAFDMFVLKDQNGKTITLQTPKDKLSENVDLNTCTNTWRRNVTQAQRDVIVGWGDYDTNTTEFEVPIWSNDNSENSWKFVGVANFYDDANPYFKVCIPDDWGSGYLNCDSPITFEQPTLLCVNTFNQLGQPVSNMNINGRTTSGQYAYGSTNNQGHTSIELTDTNISKWSFDYSSTLTGWTNIDINTSDIREVDTLTCTYEVNVTNILSPYTADLKVTVLDTSNAPVANQYVSVSHSGYGNHYYYKSAKTDADGIAHFYVEKNVDYTVRYNAGTSNVNIDGSLVSPETADSGNYADVTVKDVNQVPYAYLSINPNTVNIGVTESVRLSITASDNNPDTLSLLSLTVDGNPVSLNNVYESAWTSYYSQYGDLNISTLHQGTFEIAATISDGIDSTIVRKTLVVTGNRAPVISSPLEARMPNVSPVQTVYIAEHDSAVKPGDYMFLPNVFDPDGDALTVTMMLDGVEVNTTQTITDGMHDVNITATDGTATVSKLFTFSALNQKPVIRQAGISPNPINLSLGDSMLIYAFVSDPDGDGIGSVVATDKNTSISYTLTQQSDTYWSLDINASEIGVVEGRQFEIVATDAASIPVSSDPATVSLTIRNFNEPPVFYLPMGDQTVHIGTIVQVSAIGEDPEGTRIAFSWKVDGQPYGGTPVDGPQIGEEHINISGLTEGRHVVSCTITDTGGASATDEAVITVKNDAPKFIKQPISQEVDLNNEALFECEATDEDGAVSYIWLVDGSVLPDQTGTTLTLSYANESDHTVACQATDIYGKTSYSNIATLTVFDPDNTHPLTVHVPISGIYVSIHDAADNFKMLDTKVVDETKTAVFNLPGRNVTFSISMDPNATMSPEDLWDEVHGDLVLDAYNNCNWDQDLNISECNNADWCTLVSADTMPVWLFNAAEVTDSNDNNISGESVDTNDDGVISMDELYVEADKNNDGKVSWTEIGENEYGALFYKGVPIREYTISFEDDDYYQEPYTASSDYWFCREEGELKFNVNITDANGTIRNVYSDGSGWGSGYLAEDQQDIDFNVTVYQSDKNGLYDFIFNMESSTGGYNAYTYLLLDQTKDGLASGIVFNAKKDIQPSVYADFNITKDMGPSFDLYLMGEYNNIRMVWENCTWLDENHTQCSILDEDKLRYPLFGSLWNSGKLGDGTMVNEHRTQNNYYGDGSIQASYLTSDYPMLDVNASYDAKNTIVSFSGTELSKVDYTMIEFQGYTTDNCEEYDNYMGCYTYNVEVVSIANPTESINFGDINLSEALPANVAAGMYEAMAKSNSMEREMYIYESKDKTGGELIDAIMADEEGRYDYSFTYDPSRSVAYDLYSGSDSDLSAEATLATEQKKESDKILPVFRNPFSIKTNMKKIFDQN